MSVHLRGYALAAALKQEAEQIANDERAALVRQGALEIEALITEVRGLMESRDKLNQELNEHKVALRLVGIELRKQGGE